MLILTRKSGERIQIGEDISIVIMEVGESHIKIGIEAPQDVSVYRDEIYKRIKDE